MRKLVSFGVIAMLMVGITTTTTTPVYAQIILNITADGTTNTTTTRPPPPPQQQQQQEGEKRLYIFSNASTVKSTILEALMTSEVTNAANYGNGTGVVIFKGGPSNTSGIEIRFNHTCIPSNGCIYEDNTISLENNDTQMKAIQTQE
jgi:hypothetical protein